MGRLHPGRRFQGDLQSLHFVPSRPPATVTWSSSPRSLLDQPLFVDSSGKEHDWRADLVAALAKRQDSKGSWVNSTAGFMEGDADLVTAYGLLALAHARRRPA